MSEMNVAPFALSFALVVLGPALPARYPVRILVAAIGVAGVVLSLAAGVAMPVSKRVGDILDLAAMALLAAVILWAFLRGKPSRHGGDGQ